MCKTMNTTNSSTSLTGKRKYGKTVQIPLVAKFTIPAIAAACRMNQSNGKDEVRQRTNAAAAGAKA